MSNLILPLSNTQAKSLAGKLWTFNRRTYYFKDYDPTAPGQPPWRSGAEGKAFPLLDASGQAAAYLKFFTTPSQVRLDRTLWLVAQQIHAWAPQLCAAPFAWVDSRHGGRPDGVGFDLTGCLATAALGETWLELKYRLCENRAKFDKDLRWHCLRDLVAALAVLEQAGIVHGDLSPGNILVNARPRSGFPALSVIDFDAFVARTSGQHLVLAVSEGGTYGTAGYCPPDLVQKAEAGDLTVAPYSDRHSRDMLLLELLLAGPEFPPEAPPREWPLDKLQRRYRAFLGAVPPDSTATIAHLEPPAVFSVPEPQRPKSTDLAKTLALQLPSPAIKPFPVRPPPRASKPKPVPRPRPQPAPSPARPLAPTKPKSRQGVWAFVALVSMLFVLGWWKPWAPAPKGLNLELVEIEPGTFLMGSPGSEVDRAGDEGPQMRVTISTGFSMGKYEVTQRQYEAVVGVNPSAFKGGENLPVENVSWVDATNFCTKLTEQERRAGRLPAGFVYRLPTEAEWEYACRAGTTTRFSFGDDPQYAELGKYAWYSGNSGSRTHPVGTKSPNPWRLYDLQGNVYEWCADWYGDSLPGANVADPKGPSEGSNRVLRGGSWDYNGRNCRSAIRYHYAPGNRDYDLGFRVVLAPSQEQLAAAATAPGQPGRSEGRAEPGRSAALDLVKIEPGTFLMGSPGSEVDRAGDEGPQTRVTITKGFSMGKYEVTQGQYEAVMGTNPSSFKGNTNLPVENVSWVDATNFCAKLTEQERQAGRLPTGSMYRLPTEAEWEYACRAGTTNQFSFGDDPQYAELGKYAWYDGNSGNRTHPFGTKSPNPWGLNDLHGNVWEWCLDWKGTYPGGSLTDPKGPSGGSHRVLRGGSWFSYGRLCRSAFRRDGTPGSRDFHYGFRVVLAPGQP